MTKKLSIGSWAYIFNQEKPTNDFHEMLHKLHHLGYDGVELGSFGAIRRRCRTPPRPAGRRSRRRSPTTAWSSPASPWTCGASRSRDRRSSTRTPIALCGGVPRLHRLRRRPRHQDHPRRYRRAAGLLPDLEDGPEGRHGPAHHRLGQVQQDRGRSRHERHVGVRAGLRRSTSRRKCCTSSRACGPRATRTSACCTTPATPTCAPPSAPTSRATKETLPGGELELLEKLKGKITHVHLIDSDGSLNEHQYEHAQPVRHRQARLRQAAAGAEQAGVPQRLVVRRSVLLAATPGT